MKIASWNINSVRLRKERVKLFLTEQSPDILCLQETKTVDDSFPKGFFEEIGYGFQHVCGMKGYNGVAILSKGPFLSSAIHERCGKTDCRDISVSLEIQGKTVVLHNIYIPAGGDIPDPQQNPKFEHKLLFLDELTSYFSKKRSDQDHIILGDFNVAPLEHDVWSHKQLENVVSHTAIEIEKLNKLLEKGGFIDTAREFVPAAEKLYSWWSYRAVDWRGSNRGRRLDHIWVTKGLKPLLKQYQHFELFRDGDKPSDHIPIMLELGFTPGK